MKLKKTSKRQELSQKYNIEHKISAHKKKLKKLAKKTKTTGRKKKIAEIPNCIFKEEILRKIERIKEIKQKEKIAKNTLAQLQLANKFINNEDCNLENNAEPSLTNQAHPLILDSAVPEFNHISHQSSLTVKNNTVAVSSKHNINVPSVIRNNKAFVESDVVIQVLDARNPEFFRFPQLEQLALSMNKRVIIVLNKSDLVPKNVAISWLDYYRKSFPTILLKSGSDSKNRRVCTQYKTFLETPEYILRQTASLVGIMELSSLLANYSRLENGDRKRILVSLIGYPNVGKSSLVNALSPQNKGGHANILSQTGAMPGITTSNKSVHIDKYLHITDTPGQIFLKTTQMENIVNGAAALDDVDSLTECLGFVFSKLYDHRQLYKLFNLSCNDNSCSLSALELADDFLYKFAMDCGKLKKGGIADKECAAKIFFKKWTGGKIGYYTTPDSHHFHLDGNNCN